MIHKADRDIEKLNPVFKEKVKLFLNEVNKDKEVIFIVEATRSEARQRELVANGLSWVKYSNHQDGLAIDIWFRWKYLYPENMKTWRQIADIGKKYWIDWGFDLWAIDKPHFQNNWKVSTPIIINKQPMTKYTEILNIVLKETNFTPILDQKLWDKPLTEQETKELLEIYWARLYQRIMKEINNV